MKIAELYFAKSSVNTNLNKQRRKLDRNYGQVFNYTSIPTAKNYNKASIFIMPKSISFMGHTVHIVDGGNHATNMQHFANAISDDMDIKMHNVEVNSKDKNSFKRNIEIIDAHTHDKTMEKRGVGANSSDILKFLNKSFESDGDTFTVTKMFPSALDACFNDKTTGKPYAGEIKGNEAIIKTFEGTNIKKFLAVCQPKSGNVRNIEELFKKHPNKFIGLKFHPEGLELRADSSLYNPYMQFASKYKLPCLFHSDRTFTTNYPYIDEETGAEIISTVHKSKYSRPEQIYTLAKRYPNVPVIMAHCGGPEEKDLNAAVDIVINSAKNKDAKLYVDMSWVSTDIKDNKRNMTKFIEVVKKLKNSSSGDLTDRILFGTDAPIDVYNSSEAENIYKSYITDIHKAIKEHFGKDADKLTDKIFGKNAKNVYIDNPIINFKRLCKAYAGFIAIGAGILLGAGYIIKNKDSIFKSDY